MIHSVSFGATTPSAFQDMISKPQAYTTPAPQAASNLAGEEKDSFGKKAGKVVLGVGLAATALALASKFGGFDKIMSKLGDKNGFAKGANTVLGYADQAGKYILQGAGFVKNQAVNLYHKVADKIVKKAPEVAADVVDASV